LIVHVNVVPTQLGMSCAMHVHVKSSFGVGVSIRST